VPQAKLDHLREQLRNRPGLHEVNLRRHERGERLAVDPVLDSSSLPLIYINTNRARKRACSAASPTRAVQLCLEVRRLLSRAGGRQATGLAGPALDAAPPPDR
jgi:hypothetical protein